MGEHLAGDPDLAHQLERQAFLPILFAQFEKVAGRGRADRVHKYVDASIMIGDFGDGFFYIFDDGAVSNDRQNLRADFTADRFGGLAEFVFASCGNCE